MSPQQSSVVSSGLLLVNGAQIYYEVRGAGPTLLMIQGATGDGGTFDSAAELLSGDFTVVTYDRRGNSRSPRPAGYTAMTVEQQADDAAAVLEGLGRSPALLFGTSGGAIITLELVKRHPEVVRGAIIHEPPLVPVLSDPEAISAQLMEMVGQGMSSGGPRGAMEMFLRDAAGEETFESLDAVLRERMLGNAELFFEVELGAFASYVPSADEIGASSVPLQVVAGSEHKGIYLWAASQWVSRAAGVALREYPGTHAPYLERPKEFADALRSSLSDPAFQG